MYSNQGYKMKDTIAENNDSKMRSTPVAKVAPELKQSADSDTQITKTCAVIGCEDSKNLDANSFFRFPEDHSLRQIWTDLTGRNNWTPTDYSYICLHHFAVDCFTMDETDHMVLVDKAVPSLKLPRHVLEVEYIDEDTLDNEDLDETMNTDDETSTTQGEKSTMYQDISTTNVERLATNVERVATNGERSTTQLDMNNFHKEQFDVIDLNNLEKEQENVELLKLFSEVQRLQRQAAAMKDKLKYNLKIHNRQNRFLKRIREIIEMKKKVLNQKRKKKCRILLSLQEKIKGDTTGLVLAMPMRQTDDLKNFALSIYKYSPQAYIYIRNTLRTMLPSSEVLDSWITAGYQPRTVLTNSNLIKVVAEQTDSQLACKVMIS